MASSYPERRSPSRPLPAAGPARRRAVPLHAAARAPRRRARRARARVFAVLFLRLWALQVLSGDRYLHAAQNNQLRTIRVEAPRGSILDRAGRTLVSNVPGTRGPDLARRPAEARAATRCCKRLSKILRVPLPRLTQALEESKDDPLTPILVKTRRARGPGRLPARAPAEFPGVEVVEHLPARLPAPGARRAAARLRRRDLARGAEAARSDGRLPRRRQDRQGRRRGGLRRATCAARAGLGAAPRRLARPAAGPIRAAQAPRSRATTCG